MFVLIYEGAINWVIVHSMQLYYTLVFCTCNSFIVNMKNSNYTFLTNVTLLQKVNPLHPTRFLPNTPPTQETLALKKIQSFTLCWCARCSTRKHTIFSDMTWVHQKCSSRTRGSPSRAFGSRVQWPPCVICQRDVRKACVRHGCPSRRRITMTKRLIIFFAETPLPHNHPPHPTPNLFIWPVSQPT